MPTYILQKATHMTKVGTEFTKFVVNDLTNEEYYQNNFSAEIVPASVVENNPEWFLPKKEYDVLNIVITPSVGNSCEDYSLHIKLKRPLPKDKKILNDLKEAIERVLNNDNNFYFKKKHMEDAWRDGRGHMSKSFIKYLGSKIFTK